MKKKNKNIVLGMCGIGLFVLAITAGCLESARAVQVIVNLDDLEDVETTGVMDGEVIKFNSSSGLWEPASDISGGGGGRNPFNQDLNTSDDVVFNSVTVGCGDSSEWCQAYGWGDHSLEGYLTSESDPIYSGDPASGIAAGNISNWDVAYGWGDHSVAGYDTTNDSFLMNGDYVYTNNKTGIGTNTPLCPLHIIDPAGGILMRLTSNSSAADPSFMIETTNTVPAQQWRFAVSRTSGWFLFTDNTYSKYPFVLLPNVPSYSMRFYSTKGVFNDLANNWDFIVESQNQNDMFVIDASADGVGINDSTPEYELEVEGDITYSGVLTDDSDQRIKEIIGDLPRNKIKMFCENVTVKRYYLKSYYEDNGDLIIGDTSNKEEIGIISQDLYNFTYDTFGEKYANFIVRKGDNNSLWGVNYFAVTLIYMEYTKILNDDIQFLYNYLGVSRP